MHVLSLPPAFVLSQDQTLKLKNLISTIVTTQIDRVHPSPTLRPKRCTHQSIRSVDVSSGDLLRSPARTPPPTLLFSSQQCHRACLTRDWKEPQAPRPPLRAVQDLRLPRHQLLKNRAVDEAYLVQGPVPVNSIRKENSKIFFVFASAAQVQAKQCRSQK